MACTLVLMANVSTETYSSVEHKEKFYLIRRNDTNMGTSDFVRQIAQILKSDTDVLSMALDIHFIDLFSNFY